MRYTVTVWIEQQYTITVDAETDADAERKVRKMPVHEVTLLGSRTSDYPVHNNLTIDKIEPKDEQP